MKILRATSLGSMLLVLTEKECIYAETTKDLAIYEQF